MVPLAPRSGHAFHYTEDEIACCETNNGDGARRLKYFVRRPLQLDKAILADCGLPDQELLVVTGFRNTFELLAFAILAGPSGSIQPFK